MVRCRVGAFILICDNSVVFNEAKIFEYMVDIIFLCDTPSGCSISTDFFRSNT